MSDLDRRNPPERISSIKQGGIQYSFEFQAGRMILSAQRISDSAGVWKTVIFESRDGEIGLKSLSLVSTTLVAVDERGQMYKLNTATGKLLQPDQARTY